MKLRIKILIVILYGSTYRLSRFVYKEIPYDGKLIIVIKTKVENM